MVRQYYAAVFLRAWKTTWKTFGFKPWDLNAMLLRLFLFVIAGLLAYFLGTFDLAFKKADWFFLGLTAAVLAFVPTFLWHLVRVPALMDQEKNSELENAIRRVIREERKHEVYQALENLYKYGKELDSQIAMNPTSLRTQLDDWAQTVRDLLYRESLLTHIFSFNNVSATLRDSPLLGHRERLHVLSYIASQYGSELQTVKSD